MLVGIFVDDDSEVGVLVMPLGCHQAENHCKDLLVCLWVPSAHGCSRSRCCSLVCTAVFVCGCLGWCLHFTCCSCFNDLLIESKVKSPCCISSSGGQLLYKCCCACACVHSPGLHCEMVAWCMCTTSRSILRMWSSL